MQSNWNIPLSLFKFKTLLEKVFWQFAQSWNSTTGTTLKTKKMISAATTRFLRTPILLSNYLPLKYVQNIQSASIVTKKYPHLEKR